MAIFQDLNASVTPVRPVEQPSAIGAVADLLRGSGFFDRKEAVKPTEGETYEADWNSFLAEEKRVLQPGDPGYGDWLRTTSIKFVAKKPQYGGRVKASLEAQGIAIPVDPETSQQDARQALYTSWSSSPQGMVAEANAKRTATDNNGTFNPKVFEAKMDEAFAKHITAQADLAQLEVDTTSAEKRKTLGQTYWNKGRYFADEAIIGQVNVLSDLVEDIRDGSATITPEMSAVLGLPAGKVTTENFSTLLNKYRPVLIQSIIANTANTLASSGNVDISILEENPPSAEWITAVMGPIDEVIKAGQNFDTAAEVVKNIQDKDLLTALNNLTPAQRSVISISQLMPPELRFRIYEISNNVGWKETADKVALMFTADNPPEVIIEDVSSMSTTDANDAALVAAGALDTGAVKGPTLRSSVLTLFAGSNRVDPSQDLGIETFSALSKNSAGINQEAAMDPAFKAAVVDNVLADINKSFKKYGNLLKGQANIAYTVDDKGNVSIVPDVVGDPEMGVDFNTMQAVEMVAEQLNNSEVALTFTRKLAELDKLGAVGAEIKETFLTVNGLNIGAGEMIPAGGAGSQSTSTSPIVSVVEAGEGFITVRRQNGTEERLEGNRASRNNNPGNIQYGEFAKSAGAIGTDGRFAVFPSYEVGRAAKKKLLWDTKSYSGKTIEEAINRYAPPSENDTKSYVKTVSSAVGVPANTPMSSLSEDQKEVMLDAMERVEGFSGPVFSSSKGPDAASYFNVDKNNLPTGGSIVEIGSAKVVANSSMKPLLNSTAGASSLIKQGADVRLASVLQGPFQDLQKNFGSALVINDGLAKKGTSREKQTPGSRHFHGDALDISTVGMSDEDKLRLVDAALEAGFQGFGFGKNILHIDLGAKRAWAYGNDTFGGVPVADLKTRVQSSSVSPAEISMDPRSPQPSTGGDITTPEVDDKEGAPTGFTLFSDDFDVSPSVTPTAPTAPETMAADTAALPEAIPAETPTGTQGASELSPAIAVDKDVQAFIQEIAGDPDKSYTSEAEFLAAQERGELEPGDTVVVNGDVYVIRKNGSARRLGAVK